MQWYFEFKDWEEAFELFYRRYQRDPALAFVVSSAPEVSGYWIEPASGAEPDQHTQVYNRIEDVRRLERRIRRKRSNTKSLALGTVVI